MKERMHILKIESKMKRKKMCKKKNQIQIKNERKNMRQIESKK